MPRWGGIQSGEGTHEHTRRGVCVCTCSGRGMHKLGECACAYGGNAVLGSVHMHGGCLYVHTRCCGCVYPPLGVTGSCAHRAPGKGSQGSTHPCELGVCKLAHASAQNPRTPLPSRAVGRGLWGWGPMPRPCGGGQPTGPRLFLGNFAAFISVQIKAVIAGEMILIGV